jgi:hypothetical protein
MLLCPATGVKGTTDNADDFDDVIIELNDTAIGILGSQWMVWKPWATCNFVLLS